MIVDSWLPGRDVAPLLKWLPTFRRDMSLSSSRLQDRETLKMKATRLFEKSLTHRSSVVSQTTRILVYSFRNEYV
jgi:hypothetical protein